MTRKLMTFGILGVVAYVIHIVIGGLLWKGYNHLMQPISDLTAAGAPNKSLLSTITLIYGIFSIIFALSAFIYIKSFAPRIARTGMFIFLCMHLVSISYGLFPEDLPGASVSFTGIMHIVVTGLIIPLTISAPILIGVGLRKIDIFKRYGYYSIITGIFIFIAGGTTAVFFANKLPYFGLVERINIGALQLWTLITAIRLLTAKISIRSGFETFNV